MWGAVIDALEVAAGLPAPAAYDGGGAGLGLDGGAATRAQLLLALFHALDEPSRASVAQRLARAVVSVTSLSSPLRFARRQHQALIEHSEGGARQAPERPPWCFP
jgi:hypothetical protein